MRLTQAQRILGPIVCHYDKDARHWTLHQRPCTVLDIIAEAERWLAAKPGVLARIAAIEAQGTEPAA